MGRGEKNKNDYKNKVKEEVRVNRKEWREKQRVQIKRKEVKIGREERNMAIKERKVEIRYGESRDKKGGMEKKRRV